jgi:hypothetical protein
MNRINTSKYVISKTFKNTVVALGISLASLFSVNTLANTQTTPSIEMVISEFVVTQGQQMMNQLNAQLQQTIENELKAFTLNFSVEKVEQQVSNIIMQDDDLTTKVIMSK